MPMEALIDPEYRFLATCVPPAVNVITRESLGI